MGLQPRSIVDLIQAIFFAPALLLSLFIAAKQGWGRNGLWIYIVILSILRIVGGTTGILAQYHPNSQGIVETSIICGTVGLSPLLMGWLAVLGRINDGMSAKRLPSLLLVVMHLPIMVALALAIYGGTNVFDTNPSKVKSGLDYTKAGVLIFVAMLVIVGLLNVYYFLRKRYALIGEHKLIYAGLLALPFLIVRIIYSLLVEFNWNSPSTVFSLHSNTHKAVVVEAIMFVLMEFICVIIWLVAGFITRPVPKELLTEGGRNSGRVAQQSEQYYK